MTRRRGYRPRDGDQIPTRPTTSAEIMSAPTFGLGVADVRAERPYHRDYDLWDTNGQWGYERGRAWARLAPTHVPLRIKGRLNPAALRFYDDVII